MEYINTIITVMNRFIMDNRFSAINNKFTSNASRQSKSNQNLFSISNKNINLEGAYK